MIQNGGGFADRRRREPAHAEHAQQDADEGARRCQHEHLGQMLTDDAAARGAERHAHRHLPAAERGARDQQVRHVHAGDQQHADPRTQHREEHRVDFRPEQRLGIGDRAGADAAIGFGKLTLNLRGNDRQLRRRLFRRHAALEQANHGIYGVPALARSPAGPRATAPTAPLESERQTSAA